MVLSHKKSLRHTRYLGDALGHGRVLGDGFRLLGVARLLGLRAGRAHALSVGSAHDGDPALPDGLHSEQRKSAREFSQWSGAPQERTHLVVELVLREADRLPPDLGQLALSLFRLLRVPDT